MTIRTVSYGSALIEYRLVRSERQSLSISVMPDGVVAVAAPKQAKSEEVDARVARRARWILRQQRRFLEFRPRTPPRRYIGGETHRYLGRQYRLKIERAGKDRVVLRSGRLVVETRQPASRTRTAMLLRRWMRARASVVLRERFEAASRIVRTLGIETPRLTIQSMARRWGSHTRSGRVVLNQRLVGARRDWIDYVVVHELCHVVEPLHSPGFFRLMRRFMPDWQRRKEALERSMA
jgi:predicted metal-dependent hydrolase